MTRRFSLGLLKYMHISLIYYYPAFFGRYVALNNTSPKVFCRIRGRKNAHFTMSGFLKILYYEIPVCSTR